MVKKNEKFREQVAETLELPKDVVMNVPKTTMIGTGQLTIENHHGLIEYSDTVIRINTSIGIFKVVGRQLIIKSILPEEITIAGTIDSVDISR